MDVDKSPTLTALSSKNILITGTTGFVGKVILEKLLRSVPTVGKIFLLIRGSNTNPTAAMRFQNEVATSSIFDTLKTHNPARFAALCHEKLRFVSGELTEPNFGLSEADFRQLAQQIDVVINAAASVNFREPLDDALQINALSLHGIIQLATVNKIPVVHVSTCFVNGFNRGLMLEEVVKPCTDGIEKNVAGYYAVDGLVAELQNQIATVKARHSNHRERAQALIELGLQEASKRGWNDTYTFTKWMGEQILMQHLDAQALTIVRPSIVESTLREPVPGWIEGVKVADAIILAYAREKVTFFPGDKHAVIDIVPADLVANSIILAAAETLLVPPARRIYQCSSSDCNPVTIQQVIRHVQDEATYNFAQHKNLFLRKPSRPFIMVHNTVFNVAIWLVLVAVRLKSKWRFALGKDGSIAKMKNLEATMKLAMVFSFYTRPRYTFSSAKLWQLAQRMGELDQAVFPVNAASFDWAVYLRKIHLPGLDRFSLAPKINRTVPRRVVPQTEAA